MEIHTLSRVLFCIINYGKPITINAALKKLDVIRTTKTSLDVSSESGVHMITGPDYVMTPYQLQILLVFNGQDIKILCSLNCEVFV
jgi:hypothetical protein